MPPPVCQRCWRSGLQHSLQGDFTYLCPQQPQHPPTPANTRQAGLYPNPTTVPSPRRPQTLPIACAPPWPPSGSPSLGLGFVRPLPRSNAQRQPERSMLTGNCSLHRNSSSTPRTRPTGTSPEFAVRRLDIGVLETLPFPEAGLRLLPQAKLPAFDSRMGQ